MAKAKYGDAWESYPIKEGEIWRTNNANLLAYDLTRVDNGVIAKLFGDRKVSFVHTDPPWNPGNLKMFYTYAGKDEPTKPYNQFMRDICVLLKKVTIEDAMLFIEMGLEYHAHFIALLESMGAITSDKEIIYYGNPSRPNVLWLGSFGKEFDIEIPEGLYGQDVTKFTNSFIRDGDVFLDPCIGVGMFFRPAFRDEKDFEIFGIELQKRKLANALSYVDNDTKIIKESIYNE